MKYKETLIDFINYSIKQRVTEEGINTEALVTRYIESKGLQLLDLSTLLEVLPGKKRSKQEEIDKKTEEKNIAEYNRKGIEIRCNKEVSEEKEEGKKKYSSIAAIEREVKKRLKDNSSYKERINDLVKLSREIKELERDFDFLKDTHRSAIGKTRLLGVE